MNRTFGEIINKIILTSAFIILSSTQASFAGVDKEIDVQKVQIILTELCFKLGYVDGAWGEKTERAAEQFFNQHFDGYKGQFGATELTKLEAFNNARIQDASSGNSKTKRCRVQGGQKKQTLKAVPYRKIGSSEAKSLQFGLIALGYLKGKIDGDWDAKNSAALSKYLAKKGSKLTDKDSSKVIDLITKDLSVADVSDLHLSLTSNLIWDKYSRHALRDLLAPQQVISISDVKKMGANNVYIVVDKKVEIDANVSFGGKDKVFIIDSFVNSLSRYRNEYEVKFGGQSFLNVINSVSDSSKDKEAFLVTYSSNASALHLNYKHSMADPWQVAKGHKGQLNFIDSTCNVTLIENSRSDVRCRRADAVMIEPILPKGRYKISLPSNTKVKEWESNTSLPWTIKIEDSFVERIDFGIGPGVDLTVVDTLDFQGGIAMCCSGNGKIVGLKANKIYANQTWSVASDQGRAKLTLRNSSSGGFWPTAWGEYSFELINTDLIDPTLGSNARMRIEDSTLNMLSAKENASVIIKNSVLTGSDSKRKKVSATGSSTIRVINLRGLKQWHVYEENRGRVIFEN